MGTYKVCVYGFVRMRRNLQTDGWTPWGGRPGGGAGHRIRGWYGGTAEGGRAGHGGTDPPWRFDAARNRSLELVPEDVDLCVCTGLDEVFRPGWREVLEQA